MQTDKRGLIKLSEKAMVKKKKQHYEFGMNN